MSVLKLETCPPLTARTQVQSLRRNGGCPGVRRDLAPGGRDVGIVNSRSLGTVSLTARHGGCGFLGFSSCSRHAAGQVTCARRC